MKCFSRSGVFRELSRIPVVTSMAVAEEGRLFCGHTFPEAVKILREAGADIIGLNGTAGPQACVHLLSKLSIDKDDLIAVYPSAGKPEFYEGRFNYAASPQYFVDTMPRWVEEGARLIGGDYGTATGAYRGDGRGRAHAQTGAREEGGRGS